MGTVKKILSMSALVLAVLAVSAMSDHMGRNLDAGVPEKLENAVRQAAVSCYSTEGRYPESVAYLEQHYGLKPDGRCSVHYQIFGSNIPPEIAVTAK